jgi:hypothetical protein
MASIVADARARVVFFRLIVILRCLPVERVVGRPFSAYVPTHLLFLPRRIRRRCRRRRESLDLAAGRVEKRGRCPQPSAASTVPERHLFRQQKKMRYYQNLTLHRI